MAKKKKLVKAKKLEKKQTLTTMNGFTLTKPTDASSPN